MTSTQETEAFGRTIGGTGSTASPFGYHGADGYRSDGDGPAGLEPYQKVGARYYDATFGRFITRDTVLSQSPYAYCGGDPVNCSDPTGHMTGIPNTFETTGSTGIIEVREGGSGGDSGQADASLAAALTAGGATLVANPSSGTLTGSQGQVTMTMGNLGTQNGSAPSNGTPTFSGELGVPIGRTTLNTGVTFGGGMFTFNGGLSYDLSKGFSAVVDANGPSLQYNLLNL